MNDRRRTKRDRLHTAVWPQGADGDSLYRRRWDATPVDAERWIDDEMALTNISRLVRDRYADVLAAVDARLEP